MFLLPASGSPVSFHAVSVFSGVRKPFEVYIPPNCKEVAQPAGNKQNKKTSSELGCPCFHPLLGWMVTIFFGSLEPEGEFGHPSPY